MRSDRTSHGFVALRLEGGILPAEFFQKVAALEAKKQKIFDYRLAKGLNIRDEIGRAWRIAIAEWRDYQEHRIRSNADQYEIGVKRWLVALFKQVLGFEDIHPSDCILLAERRFPINYRGENNTVPIVLTTHDYLLDKSNSLFGEEGRKRSPHGLLQEYLNADETCLWGIVSNGLKIRLLRDNPSLTRPAYIEADLQRIFEEELFADFAAFWLIFHASRFGSADGVYEHCALEEWRAEAHEVGERALAELQKCVKKALRELGNGFIQYQGNTRLRAALQDGSFSPMEYYQELLKLVYRFIFLSTAEDRDILHIPGDNEEGKKLYHEGYSIARLREMALKRHNYDVYPDLWEGLQITFKGLTQGADPLRLPALGGLFTTEQCPWLDGALIDNNRLLNAIYSLSFFRTGEVLARINYHDMDTEELGSVYESLLELHPQVNVEALPWTFSFAGEDTGAGVSGSERKLSGSYYTPDSLVQELIKSALEPVITRILTENPQDPATALLKLKIIDPACGSGHFLLAAARRLAAELARLEADTNQQDEDLYRHSMRMVVQKCIYGVDLNPMAVELCKTALWLETIEPGMPLGFLDNHIRCGNSLVGVRDPKIMADGIPDAAFKALSGDDPNAAKELKKVNKQVGKSVHGNLFSDDTLAFEPSYFAIIDDMPEDSLSDIKAKKEAFLKAQQDTVARRMADLFTAAFFAPKTQSNLDAVPLTEDLNRARKLMVPRERVLGTAHELANKYHFFQWYLEFPQVFATGGFDVVLGNPPWERIKLQEEEFFASRSPEIAKAHNKAARERMIKKLATPNASPAERMLYQEFIETRRGAEATSEFVRNGGLYPLTGVGDVNTYALFAELFLGLLNPKGRAGIIVPSGIATDDSTKAYFDEIAGNKRLVSLFDFENREKIFKAVDSRMKFSLLTLGVNVGQAVFCFFATNTSQITEPHRRFTLSADDIRLLNPNTRTCPIFRSQADAELTQKIYSRVPIFSELTQSNGNPWKENLSRIFDMGKKTEQQLAEKSEPLNSYQLYEAKYFNQYDHRFSTICPNGSDIIVINHEKQNPNYEIDSKFIMEVAETEKRLTSSKSYSRWLIAYRNITNATNERTIIASVLPRCATNYSVRLCIVEAPITYQACLLGNLNSIVADYVVRQKIGGTNLSDYIFRQIAILSPQNYTPENIEYIVPRVLELVFTSECIRPFAEDLGYTGEPFVWNPERRALIRAELDAAFFHLYLGSEHEWKESGTKELLEHFPMPRRAVDFIMETFPIVKRKDEQKYGRYYTKVTILEIYDDMVQIMAENATAVAAGREPTAHYQTRLNPPPGPPCDADGKFIPMARWDRANWPSHIHLPKEEAVEAIRIDESILAATSYPGNDTDRAICVAALSIVEKFDGLTRMDHLDTLLLTTHPDWCKVFLSPAEQSAFKSAVSKAPVALFVAQNQSIRWKTCLDYLEQRKAVTVNRKHAEHPIRPGTDLATVKSDLSQEVEKIVEYALKALKHVKDIRNDLTSLPQEQRNVLSVIERQHQEYALVV